MMSLNLVFALHVYYLQARAYDIKACGVATSSGLLGFWKKKFDFEENFSRFISKALVATFILRFLCILFSDTTSLQVFEGQEWGFSGFAWHW